MKDDQAAQNDLAVARAAAQTAAAAVAAARNRLTILGKSPAEIAQLESDRAGRRANAETIVRAPIAGVVASRSVAVGQYLTSGSTTPASVITDNAAVWLVAQVPEAASAQVHLGDRVSVTTTALPGRTFAARIDNIGPGLDPATHRLPVRATIANPDRVLRPQMFASFVIRTAGGGGGVRVPASAVIHEGDTARVWVAGPKHVLRACSVERPSDGGMVTVTRGLAAGDRIVTAGAIFINEAGLPS